MNFVRSMTIALALSLGTIALINTMGHPVAQASCDPPPSDPPKQPPKK
ncbi:hypothetical protein H6F86_17670 [Phormidium sp. FACHB-592]|uniref:Uncharacterized protein n=1 Tax=Stenomitos frigidus AS-A4 TaxID=2933935 RepID=A0ABV0KID7_9CYAN|nr:MULTISPECIES: hypothetical protein [Cyanophyceae]MBD2035871.1 hypothetical protein [Leptolyngbya sp. FACHB-321]MBD2075684.1 hypothetical protein [Phormidium sp. FACHB-592]